MSPTMVTLSEGNWNAWDEYIFPHLNVLGCWECVNPGWDRPITGNPQDAAERKELREWSKAQGAALGAILESIDGPNKRLVKDKDAKDAYALLKTTHNQSNAARQFQLFQQILSIHQTPQETLPAYFQRIEAACDDLQASFTTATTHLTLLDMLATFIALTNVQDDDQNERFTQIITTGGTLTRTEVATQFRAEQLRRETMATAKEAGL
ncbi:hypothetical protein FRC01_011474, partial [Tulasnella sp. 417]